VNDLTAFVSTVVGALNDAGFPYLVTGSFASIVYSEPRTTMDIDVVGVAMFWWTRGCDRSGCSGRSVDLGGGAVAEALLVA